MVYIHLNPEAHKVYQDFKNYRFSSYRQLIGCSYSFLQKEEVLEWFGDIGNLEFVHLKRREIVELREELEV